MSNRQSNIDDIDIAELLGMHGFILEDACRNLISNTKGYEVREFRYPVKNYGGGETEIDLIVICNKIFIIIECKREDPENKKWLFSRTKPFNMEPKHIVLERKNDKTYPDPNIEHVVDKPDIELCPWLEFFDFGICMRNKSKGENKKNGADNSKFILDASIIHDACKQLMLGLGGLVNEQKNQLDKYSTVKTLRYLPVIITTAKLNSFEYENNCINIETGRIEGEIKTDELKYLIYKWSSASDIYGEVIPKNIHSLDPEDIKRRFKSWDIIIVQASSLSEFLVEFNYRI